MLQTIDILLLDEEPCSHNTTVYMSDSGIPHCRSSSWLAMTIFFVYILITTILLVNLLIAIFRLCKCAVQVLKFWTKYDFYNYLFYVVFKWPNFTLATRLFPVEHTEEPWFYCVPQLGTSDDIVLLALSWCGLQTLLAILFDDANAIDMPFSASKTVCMVFNRHKSKRKQRLGNLGRKRLKGGCETGKKRHLRV